MSDVPLCTHCNTEGPDPARKWGLCRTCYGNAGTRNLYRGFRQSAGLTVTAIKNRRKRTKPIESITADSLIKLASFAAAARKKEQTLLDYTTLEAKQQQRERDKIEEAQLDQMIAEQMRCLPAWWESEHGRRD